MLHAFRRRTKLYENPLVMDTQSQRDDEVAEHVAGSDAQTKKALLPEALPVETETQNGAATRQHFGNHPQFRAMPDARPFRKFQFVHPSQQHQPLLFHINRARELIESPLVYIYAFSIAQFVRSFNLYHAIEAGEQPFDDKTVSTEAESYPVGSLASKLLYGMIMAGGKAANFATTSFIENHPKFQEAVCRMLDHDFVNQYEQYVKKWKELDRTNCNAANDPNKLTILQCLESNSKPFLKKVLISQVFTLAETHNLPASVAIHSIHERRFGSLVHWLNEYNANKPSERKNFDSQRNSDDTRRSARLIAHFESICSPTDVTLCRRFLEFVLASQCFDGFATLYYRWNVSDEHATAGDEPLESLVSTTPVPVKVQNMAQIIRNELEQAENDDMELQLWSKICDSKPSTYSLSEYCREKPPTKTEKAVGSQWKKASALKTVVKNDVKLQASDESMQNGAASVSPSAPPVGDIVANMSSPVHSAENTRYLSLDLTFGQVQVITRPEQLRVFTAQLKTIAAQNRHHNMLLVGIDCEGFGNQGLQRDQRISLLQISLNGERVVIVDIQTILAAAVDSAVASEIENENLWSEFSQALFFEPLFRKILFSGKADLDLLSRLPGFNVPKSAKAHVTYNVVDLSHIYRYLVRHKPSCLGLKPEQKKDTKFRWGNVSLKLLVQLLLDGAELDKTEQVSGWRHRPLRLMQVIYAALDAHVLVLLYKRLEENCKREAVEFPPPSSLPKTKIVSVGVRDSAKQTYRNEARKRKNFRVA